MYPLAPFAGEPGMFNNPILQKSSQYLDRPFRSLCFHTVAHLGYPPSSLRPYPSVIAACSPHLPSPSPHTPPLYPPTPRPCRIRRAARRAARSRLSSRRRRRLCRLLRRRSRFRNRLLRRLRTVEAFVSMKLGSDCRRFEGKGRGGEGRGTGRTSAAPLTY